MNIKLILLLQDITEHKSISHEQVQKIEKESIKLQKLFDKRALKVPDILKQHAKITYNQLVDAIAGIEKSKLNSDSKIINGIGHSQLEHLDEQLAHLKNVLNICTDLQADMLEHLIAYYPNEYETKQAELKKIHPNSIVLKSIKTKPIEQIKPDPEAFTFINNFDNIPSIDVYNHFQQLVKKGYLQEQELREYLHHAFELQVIPKTLFKFKHTPTKQTVYLVFYTYYKEVAGKPNRKQGRYAELLGNYFEGHETKIIKTNWGRSYKTKR